MHDSPTHHRQYVIRFFNTPLAKSTIRILTIIVTKVTIVTTGMSVLCDESGDLDNSDDSDGSDVCDRALNRMT